jgi:predicted ribosome quality control (RQC) complex YloA/Tae2 family protein
VVPGASEARVPDPWDPEAREVVVPLDPALTPEANAARYFRRARRAGRALLEIPARLEAARSRLARAGEWTARLDAVSAWQELAPLAAEARADAAIAARFARAAAAGASGTATPGTQPDVVARRLRNLTIRPRRIVLAPGWIALVGRTSRENDVLTTRAASPRDLWFHARGVAGSHVVVIRPSRDAEPPPEVVRRAAIAAAWFSQGRT